MKVTHGQLFAGIGGFGLAAQWAGIENIWANEIDPFCCKVLRKNFVNLKIYEQDIREIGSHNLSPIDIITGGFPCQPFSHAGKRKGKEDDRYLWPEMLRIIKEVKPSWVVGENVAGLKSMENGKTLERIFIDLENIGYQVEAFSIPASAIGAWHRRDRIWIIAHNDGIGWGKWSYPEGCNGTQIQDRRFCGDVPNTNSRRRDYGSRSRIDTTKDNGSKEKGKRLWDVTITNKSSFIRKREQWKIEPDVGRVAHGISSRVDRLKSLGNAIVPQVAYEIFKAILSYNQPSRIIQ